MNCPSCGAPLRLPEVGDSPICDYCGSVSLPEKDEDGVRILGEASATECPVCRVPLAPASLLHRRFLYCTRCRGSLIPMPVFVALVQELRARSAGAAQPPHPPDPRELQRALRCPQCGAAMDTHYYEGGGNVVIDDCSRCELNWLDSGELQTIGRAGDHSPRDSQDWREETET
jgi:Zn-finger nucleic acid-binding protein